MVNNFDDFGSQCLQTVSRLSCVARVWIQALSTGATKRFCFSRWGNYWRYHPLESAACAVWKSLTIGRTAVIIDGTGIWFLCRGCGCLMVLAFLLWSPWKIRICLSYEDSLFVVTSDCDMLSVVGYDSSLWFHDLIASDDEPWSTVLITAIDYWKHILSANINDRCCYCVRISLFHGLQVQQRPFVDAYNVYVLKGSFCDIKAYFLELLQLCWCLQCFCPNLWKGSVRISSSSSLTPGPNRPRYPIPAFWLGSPESTEDARGDVEAIEVLCRKGLGLWVGVTGGDWHPNHLSWLSCEQNNNI